MATGNLHIEVNPVKDMYPKPKVTMPKRMRSEVKVYDKVLSVLQDHPETRESDDLLFWQVLFDLAFVVRKGDMFGNEYWLSKSEMLKAPYYESIRRSRQKAAKLHPELEPRNEEVRKRRRLKQSFGGNFVFHESGRERK